MGINIIYVYIYIYRDSDAPKKRPFPGLSGSKNQVEQTKMRMANFQENLAACGGDLVQISESYKSFGLQKQGSRWSYCEWMPYAKEVYLVGDFNDWVTSATPLTQESPDAFPDVWSATLPTTANLRNGSKYKLFVVPEERVKVHVNRVD